MVVEEPEDPRLKSTGERLEHQRDTQMWRPSGLVPMILLQICTRGNLVVHIIQFINVFKRFSPRTFIILRTFVLEN